MPGHPAHPENTSPKFNPIPLQDDIFDDLAKAALPNGSEVEYNSDDIQVVFADPEHETISLHFPIKPLYLKPPEQKVNDLGLSV